MSTAIFIRLTGQDDKQSGLAECISAIAAGLDLKESVFLRKLSVFQSLPFHTLGYWVSPRIAGVFADSDQFEASDRSAKQGLATADDFRFVRLWWEVPPRNVIKPQAQEGSHDNLMFRQDCLRQAEQSKTWAPFAKGGAYSPFFADIALVVNWRRDGVEIRNFTNPKNNRLASRPQNTDHFFLPGLTWSLRTAKGVTFRALPAGCIFGHKGPAAFADDPLSYLGLLNSRPFKALLGMHMAVGSYEVGVINRNPVPRNIPEDVSNLALRAFYARRDCLRVDETDHCFSVPAILRRPRGTLRDATAAWREEASSAERCLALCQRELDVTAMQLYGFDTADLGALEAALASQAFGIATDQEDEVEEDIGASDTGLTAQLLAYAIGVAFGRWDICVAMEESRERTLPGPFDPLPVCSPGMLQGPDRMPLEPERDGVRKVNRQSPYPIAIPWDGLLVDDPNHPLDIARRVHEVIEIIWNDRSEAIENEACKILSVASLREYFRKPSGFFAEHLKRYSKSRRQAPIYWPLSTASGSYTVWLYYHRFSKDTLYKVLEHVKKKIAHEEQQHTHLLAEGGSSPSAEWRKTLTAKVEFVTELRSFYEEVARVAPLWNPDLDDGVVVTYSLLWRMIAYKPWQKTVRACWDELAAGKHDWARLAMHLWPDRVVPKCAMDRSLAIAHGLEGIFWVEAADGKWAARATPLKPIDSIIRERSSPAVNTALRGLIEPQTVSGNSRTSGRRKATLTGNRK